MQLIAIEYPERRCNFFKEQLAAAHRRLDWSMKHNPDWNDHAEKGEVVSFYEWAVKMAERNEIHGEWVACGDGENVPWMCSRCGKTTAHKYKTMYGKYCPNCGSRMNGR